MHFSNYLEELVIENILPRIFKFIKIIRMTKSKPITLALKRRKKMIIFHGLSLKPNDKMLIALSIIATHELAATKWKALSVEL